MPSIIRSCSFGIPTECTEVDAFRNAPTLEIHLIRNSFNFRISNIIRLTLEPSFHLFSGRTNERTTSNYEIHTLTTSHLNLEKNWMKNDDVHRSRSVGKRRNDGEKKLFFRMNGEYSQSPFFDDRPRPTTNPFRIILINNSASVCDAMNGADRNE